jgi:hypothetical protein
VLVGELGADSQTVNYQNMTSCVAAGQRRRQMS